MAVFALARLEFILGILSTYTNVDKECSGTRKKTTTPTYTTDETNINDSESVYWIHQMNFCNDLRKQHLPHRSQMK